MASKKTDSAKKNVKQAAIKKAGKPIFRKSLNSSIIKNAEKLLAKSKKTKFFPE